MFVYREEYYVGARTQPKDDHKPRWVANKREWKEKMQRLAGKAEVVTASTSRPRLTVGA